MSVLIMDMNNHEVRQNNFESVEDNDEVLCASWVPTLAVQQASSFESRASIPEDLVNVDAELFLRKMYALQR